MTLTVERTAPNTLVCTRLFAAPPERVWAAHVEPDLLRQWMYGFEGWSLSGCEIDARPGGGFRYEWREDATGNGFHATGEFEVMEWPHRMVHVERMFLPDRTPENHVETRFDPEGTGTRMTMTMQVADAATMDTMIATGMTDGMEVTYSRIDSLA